MAAARAAFSPEQNWFRRRDAELVRVRVFSPKGLYPSGRINLPSGFYHADASLAVLVTKGYSWHHYLEECGFDEFESPFPAESIFMGSMILCEKPDEPCIRFYPHTTPVFLLDPATVDLTDASSQEDILTLIRDSAGWPVHLASRDYYARFFSSPIELFSSSALELSRLLNTWELVRPDNFVLLRGLVALMKSDMLAAHREFGAEALMSLYIALECSFQLVLQHLKDAGKPSPSASDAARWMHDVFDQHFNIEEPDPSYKYFQEFYEGRVVMFHPRSRFGDLPYAPNFWDDVIHLRRSLPGVFAYLVHGEHSSSFLESVDEFRGVRRTT